MGAQRGITEQELLENLGWVRALAARLVGERGEDLTHEVCVAALDRGRIDAAGGAVGRRVRAWLARATVFLAHKDRRAERTRRERERRTARVEAQPSTFDIVERNALVATLVQAVQDLAEPYRTTVLLRYLDQQPTRSIAEATGVSEVVVRKRLSRGMARLRTALDQRRIHLRSLAALAGLAQLRATPWTLTAATTATTTPTIGAMTMASTLTKAAGASAVVGGASLVVLMNLQDPLPLPEPGAEPVAEEVNAELEPLPDPVAGPEITPDAGLTAPSELAAFPGRQPAPAAEREALDPGPTGVQVDPRALAAMEARAELEAQLEAAMVNLDRLMIAQIEAEKRPEDGYRVETYDDGSRKAAGHIVDGYRQGEWEFWYPSGARKSRGEFQAGKRQGPWITWSEEGAEIAVGDYLYGREEGSWIHVEEGTTIQAEYRDGEVHGSRRKLREDGSVALEEELFRDRRHGLASSYHPSGQLASQGNWEHGSRVGVWNYWFEDGTLDEERSGVVEAKPSATREAILAERHEIEARMKEVRSQLKIKLR